MVMRIAANGQSSKQNQSGSEEGQPRRQAAAVATVFLVASEPTFLTPTHGLPAAVVAFLITVFLLAGIPRQRSSAYWLLPAILVVVVGSSFAWSILPSETLLGGAALAVLTITAYWIAAKVSLPSFINGLIAGAFTALLLSLLLAAVRPDLGLVAEAYKFGSLRGIYEHRNQMGYTMTIGVVGLAMNGRIWRGSRRTWAILLLVAFVGAVGYSASSSALAMTAFALILALVVRSISKSKVKLRLFLLTHYVLVGAFGCWLVFNQFGAVTGLLGRDETLTGRTTIWPPVIEAWSYSPMLGYGWGAVWSDDSFVADWVSRQVDGYRVYHAHDSYLDVLIQIGIIGLIAFGLCLLFSLFRSGLWLNLALRDQLSLDWAFPNALITTMALYSIVETRISHPLGLLVIFYVILLRSPIQEMRPRGYQRRAYKYAPLPNK
ncbi:O-antigen ligase family protein [Pseudarthrobacter phenanthrenivorans]|uniref:O-antigen ligase family protein n=1 Tax=Pseudarthrobacter phenanthrenivorans TaxID=361575 RepID=UPI00344F5842